MKKSVFVLASVIMLLVLVVCGAGIAEEEASAAVGLANPWTEVATAEEAADGAGVGYFLVPEENMEDLNRMRKEFAKKKFSFLDRSVTFSGGYVWFDMKTDLSRAVREAEEALARAKNSGKNKILSTGESEDMTDG